MTTTTDPIKRLFQIFSARLVLEVFGGGGAIWGFSEVCTLRRPETQEFWRMNASIIASIFAVRWIMQIRDYLLEMNGTKVDLNEGTLKRLLQIFSARLVLEVFGGGGAIWGFSEVLTLRNSETIEFWRYNASVVAIIFAVRFLLQIREYTTQHWGTPATTAEQTGLLV
eukprot:CAMPEP_0183292630 /NCGR_PEP_ID=MMETSP0160_2-20130417/1621_1 /TAXON_ID=2839 ORGANISM="Odontella Sinensis, Strain Grunow 1884" /NCGR_SAMPLE_ID=MMETSP0160_2 /ASSEMBLY_ACC=CAM_ASM_000250 /LENGTH=167 /DNA_ID=CAMNT_0025453613 /DNA_START=20 /DNA_END=523 /DNA_ORIENTATION=+